MVSSALAESDLESIVLKYLSSLGWVVKHGQEIAPGGSFAERQDFGQVVLEGRLRDALHRLNPEVPEEVLDEAFRRLINPDGATVEARNRAFHRMLIDGVTVEYRRPDGSIGGVQVAAVDFENPENNDWLAVNQFTVVENHCTRRPDVVLFVNGLPLAVIELKNPADEEATIWVAFNQLQTYRAEIPSLFVFNELLVISDGLEARLGTLTSGREWFKPWKTITGERIEEELPQIEVLIRGVFDKRLFLELIRDFIVFEDTGGGGFAKKVAGYHQFHAVRIAIAETLRAALPDGGGGNGTSLERKPGDRRIGVVWHTQGSGKSLTMVFYAARLAREKAMGNPTIVVITDRNDLDNQLFGMFCRSVEILRQTPIQAESRTHLRQLLSRASGGIIFTTLQKFLPEEKGDWNPVLSHRRNIVVIADEAHRSHYDFIDGLARHMRDTLPNASFIAFTGTPLELEDRNTRQVFGDYISIYDIKQAVEDGATVPIYYESRLAKLNLPEELKPRIDEEFEEVTEDEEVEQKERLKTKWAQLEAVVGAERRLRLIARDIVEHFEKRLEVLEGKAMVVCMSRRICVELYREIVRLRPEWHHDDDNKGVIKVVMTGSAADPPDWQPHIRNKERREALANRFRNPDDPLKIVLVRDMWLTGFDAPPLHTMYIDKPLRGHTLMQAIARVNRVFRDKPGGLIVDYLGIAQELKKAMVIYTANRGRGDVTISQDEAVAVMLEKYEVCCDLFHGFDWSPWKSGTSEERLKLLASALEHVLGLPDGKSRFLIAVTELSKAFALAVPHEEALRIRDDVAFFQTARAALLKHAPREPKSEVDVEHAIRQIVSRAIVPEGVIDLFEIAGFKKPDISVLSEEFLAEVQGIPQKNLAVELLRKLIHGEIKVRQRKNVTQYRRFSEMLEATIRRYHNRAIEAVEVIEELIRLAREIREANRRGEKLGLSEEELAFYDALGTSDSAVQALGEPVLRQIAQELVRAVRENVTVDWAIRESARANLRVVVKRILRKYGYPPDRQEKAVQTVIEQAEVLSAE